MKYLVTILFLFWTQAFSVQLESIKVSPLNRSYFFFNEIPKYSAELNAEKSRLTLSLAGTNFSDIQQLNSSGVIKGVSPISRNDSTIVFIDFSSSGKGYTITPLPYSKSLMIDIFEWDRLSEEESKYRQALFAYESELENTKQELQVAMDAGSKQASAIMALSYLIELDAEKAAPYLFQAFRDSSRIPDIYAGISEILAIKGNEKLRSEFLQQFKSFTGKSNFPNLAVNYDSNNIQIPDYFYPDSKNIPSNDNNSSSLNAKDMANDSTQIANSNEDDISILEAFGLNPMYLIFVGFAGIILLGFLYWTYTKWKKDQINKMKQVSKTKFDDEVRKAKENNERKAAELKRKREEPPKQNSKNNSNTKKQKNPAQGNLLNKKYGATTSTSENDNIDVSNLNQKKVRPVENVKQDENQSQIEKFLESYLPVKKELEKEKTERDNQPDDVYFDDSNENSKSPNTELAMKLAGEKHKKKQEQLLKLANDKKSDDDIDKKAKDMGLEKGTIETKSSISKLSDDDKRLKKLGDKFKLDSGNSNNNE